MATSTNTIAVTMTQLDSNGVNILGAINQNGRSIGPIQWAGTSGQFTEAMNIGVGSTVLSLPISPVVNVYFKNQHATQTVTITATPNGAASVVVGTIGPGEAFFYWGTSAARGYTAIALQANGANTPVEMFLGG